MGVIQLLSTIDGGHTPICNSCGVTLCWDILDEEYRDKQLFWDNWECRDCNPSAHGSRKRWVAQQPISTHNRR